MVQNSLIFIPMKIVSNDGVNKSLVALTEEPKRELPPDPIVES